MNIIIQPTLSSCGPVSIYNIAILKNIKLCLNKLKKQCKTDRNGTFSHDFENVLRKKFKYKKKEYTKLSELKKDLKNYYVILAYDYYLNKNELEGHYTVCQLKNNSVISHNSYSIENASKINYKNRKKLLKREFVITREEFNKYYNIEAYLIPKT